MGTRLPKTKSKGVGVGRLDLFVHVHPSMDDVWGFLMLSLLKIPFDTIRMPCGQNLGVRIS